MYRFCIPDYCTHHVLHEAGHVSELPVAHPARVRTRGHAVILRVRIAPAVELQLRAGLHELARSFIAGHEAVDLQ